jgi:hypothetical protein
VKRKKIFSLALIIAVVITAVYFIYPALSGRQNTDFFPVSPSEFVFMDEDEELYTFSDGWVIYGESGSPRFYDWNKKQIEPLLSREDSEAEEEREAEEDGEEFKITAITEHYMVIDNSRIYDTRTLPFKLVYENPDLNIWSIKEFTGFLVLLIKNEKDLAEPYILAENSSFLISLEGMGNAAYVDMDAYERNVSLLTISIDSPVPLSRVFHYVNRNEIYGVLTVKDQLIYKIFRLKNNIILMGIKELMCYNVEGELKWSIPHLSEGRFEVLNENDYLLFYFPDLGKLDDKPGNALLVTEDGYDIKIFPKYLRYIGAYGKGYIGLESDHTIILFNNNGKITKKQNLGIQVKKINMFNKDQASFLFLQTKNNELQLYTSEKQEEKSE